ncbi:hypothetical protein N7456_012038 [Penicillium angulare]|uniref:Amino acid permease/ SLC12A domain-containing protein n=1 Tax=Penicillium angulare TaxID=116970 RepID=A0A9W9EUR5_9EURO|nr:hypothetical protein N7456_012038 [Penicillium angulare]
MSTNFDEKENQDGCLSKLESNKVGEVITEDQLHRDFKPRHVMMFSIACSIGTGLVIGSGSALTAGGPGSLFLAYALVGIAVFFVMTSIGEMAAYLPMSKGFSGYGTRMVDPAFGFATGWNYFFKYLIAAPTNLTAAGLVVQYWRPDLNVAIWIAVFGIAVVSVNVLPVKNFGETEFWLGMIKVVVMFTVIIVCLVIALGGGPNHYRSGFSYWDPNAFKEYLVNGDKGRLLGWWACMCQACFAYTGTEVVGMTFGETPNPRKNIPKAVKQTFWRIGSFYVIGVLVLGMAVPSDDPRLLGATEASTSAAASPFVVAIRNAGISVLPDIINASLLVFTISAASSDIYCASRTLYSLAKDGQAPRIFAKTLDSGIPAWSVVASAVFIGLGFLNASKSTSVVFTYLVSLVTIFAVLNWVAILVSYLHFRRAVKAQSVPLNTMPYIGALQPYGAWYALFVSLLVIVFNGYDSFVHSFSATTFVLKYLGTALFVTNIGWWKLYRRTSYLKPKEVDLITVDITAQD